MRRAGGRRVASTSRRRLLVLAAAGAMSGTVAPLLSACSRYQPPLRVATNVWPGNEFLYLAREKGYFGDEIRLVELPSASSILHALAAGTLEGASLTIDEALSASASGLSLTIVAVLDESRGADVLLARPGIRSLPDLRGKRIGAELDAVGAVILDGALRTAGLTSADIVLVPLTVDAHELAWAAGSVDALITFQPVAGRLQEAGAQRLFDSTQLPGRIIDVLVCRTEVLVDQSRAVRRLVEAHFRARRDFVDSPTAHAGVLARRLRVAPEHVPAVYAGLHLPDPQENRDWLRSPGGRLQERLPRLARELAATGLLEGASPALPAVSAHFLPVWPA